jgi:hypothetical protein
MPMLNRRLIIEELQLRVHHNEKNEFALRSYAPYMLSLGLLPDKLAANSKRFRTNEQLTLAKATILCVEYPSPRVRQL